MLRACRCDLNIQCFARSDLPDYTDSDALHVCLSHLKPQVIIIHECEHPFNALANLTGSAPISFLGQNYCLKHALYVRWVQDCSITRTNYAHEQLSTASCDVIQKSARMWSMMNDDQLKAALGERHAPYTIRCFGVYLPRENRIGYTQLYRRRKKSGKSIFL